MKYDAVKKTLFCTGLISLSCAASAVASSGSGHGDEVYTFVGDWLPRLVNFGIIAAAVFFLAKTPIRAFFKNRSTDIARAMQESQEARERAVADLAEMEQKIKELEAETGKMITEARVRGEKDKKALEEEGKKIAQDIQHQVKQGIEMEVRKAKSALATEAAILSLDLAEGRIKKGISNKDHERMAKEYIASVGGKG
jgi:F-type H+-transporting ATPase subunit b